MVPNSANPLASSRGNAELNGTFRWPIRYGGRLEPRQEVFLAVDGERPAPGDWPWGAGTHVLCPGALVSWFLPLPGVAETCRDYTAPSRMRTEFRSACGMKT